MRDGVIGIGGRLRNVESERPVPHELSLHERLVVREHESAVRAALRQLGRPRERPVLHMGEIGRLAVRDVENVGRDTRMEVRDRGVVEVPRQSEVDRVVCCRCPDLPPLGIEQPLAGRVVVDVEGEIDAVVQTRDRLRLGLGLLGRAAIRIAGCDSGGAFVVVVPVLRVVPVRIDAVSDLGRPVAVVVTKVLPPQPRVGARENVYWYPSGFATSTNQSSFSRSLIALLFARHCAIEVGEQPAVDLGRDPPRACCADVEHRRPRPVGHLAGALRQLEGDDLAPLAGVPDDLELRQLRIPTRDVVEVGAEPSDPS